MAAPSLVLSAVAASSSLLEEQLHTDRLQFDVTEHIMSLKRAVQAMVVMQEQLLERKLHLSTLHASAVAERNEALLRESAALDRNERLSHELVEVEAAKNSLCESLNALSAQQTVRERVAKRS